jgi:hypothetical protein
MEAIEWAHAHGAPHDEPEVVSDRPWARVTRLGHVWLKECRPVQAYEVSLTLALAARWPDRVAAVLAADPERAWLLLADAGTPLRASDDVLEAFVAALPLYAELQQGETAHAVEHLAAGVPDLRPETLPARYERWAERERRLAPFSSRFAELCDVLVQRSPTVQHDDLHTANVYGRDGRVVFLDWGDTCIAHPFATLWITFRLVRHDYDTAWLPRLRKAYLEPWGRDLDDELDAALQVAAFARLLQWERIGETDALARNLEWFLENIAAS